MMVRYEGLLLGGHTRLTESGKDVDVYGTQRVRVDATRCLVSPCSIAYRKVQKQDRAS